MTSLVPLCSRRLHGPQRGGPAAPATPEQEADTEPGAILSDAELEALWARHPMPAPATECRTNVRPLPRPRLVEASLDRQIAAKRETRTLPQLLLATGAMQVGRLDRWTRLQITLTRLLAWARNTARTAWRRCTRRHRLAENARRARERCRAQLRELRRTGA